MTLEEALKITCDNAERHLASSGLDRARDWEALKVVREVRIIWKRDDTVRLKE